MARFEDWGLRVGTAISRFARDHSPFAKHSLSERGGVSPWFLGVSPVFF